MSTTSASPIFYVTHRSCLIKISTKKSKSTAAALPQLQDSKAIKTTSAASPTTSKTAAAITGATTTTTKQLVDVEASIIHIKQPQRPLDDIHLAKEKELRGFNRQGQWDYVSYERGANIDVMASESLPITSLITCGVVLCNVDCQQHIVLVLQLSSGLVQLGYLDDNSSLECSYFVALCEPFTYNKKKHCRLLDGPMLVCHDNDSNKITVHSPSTRDDNISTTHHTLPFEEKDITIHSCFIDVGNTGSVVGLNMIVQQRSPQSKLITIDINTMESKSIKADSKQLDSLQVVNSYANDIDNRVFLLASNNSVSLNRYKKVICTIALPHPPTQVYMVNIPYEFKLDKIDKRDPWDQGAIIVHFGAQDLAHIYSLSTKNRLNEVAMIKDIWIHDFYSDGSDQILIRHSQTKAITLTLIPMHMGSSGGNNNQDGASEHQNGKLSSKFSLDMVVESLEMRCTQATSELAYLNSTLRSKELLLEHSLKVLNSLGRPNSNYNTPGTPLRDGRVWADIDLVSLFTNESVEGHAGPKQAPVQSYPKLSASDRWMKDHTLYCLFNFTNPGVEDILITSIFLCSDSMTFECKSSCSNVTQLQRLRGNITSGSLDERTIYLECTLPIVFDVKQTITAIVEWRKLQTTNNNESKVSYVDSFTLTKESLEAFKPHPINLDIVNTFPIEFLFNINQPTRQQSTNIDLLQEHLQTAITSLFPTLGADSCIIDNNGLELTFNEGSSQMGPIRINLEKNSRNTFLNLSMHSFKVSSVFSFISQLITKLSGCNDNSNLSDVHITLSLNNGWYQSLSKELCQSLNQEMKLIEDKAAIFDNKLSLNKRDQREQYKQYYELYQSLSVLMADTEGLLYNMTMMDKYYNCASQGSK
ncbi:hypothetical protein SAMD00019534_001420 [Acytostelium subglobosum LB1]|uniref:hypothetical protein n=1 Tax=Acytostelium subglobosum LB1 TaxID=1410327 RepID=UPI0006451CA2|nr:hypothetical protein SAMD00019534_001420 [Acytostelium subglobosum LB1]GAM16967.1 hypothetical protein SAMD00019534_001420 [Acytostelium subglobosum LB1]|eukprot:XP_012759029.1 hypothetical protein SAMD00019534_001420 [Acytostelium subglobosum LB1]